MLTPATLIGGLIVVGSTISTVHGNARRRRATVQPISHPAE
jgi:hypothetical protein